MFDNPGEKIKTVAKVFFGIGCVSSVLGWIGVLIIAMESKDGKTALLIALASFLVLAIGVVLSWISSLLLYGFGQLIDNSDRTSATMDTLVNLTAIDNRCQQKPSSKNSEFKEEF